VLGVFGVLRPLNVEKIYFTTSEYYELNFVILVGSRAFGYVVVYKIEMLVLKSM